jgi:hypothetical protein
MSLADRALWSLLIIGCSFAAAQTDPRGFGSRYIDQYREGFEDLALRHPKEWKTYGRLWLVGMKRADEIEAAFLAGHDYYAASWIKTERQKDGTSDLTFHATEWGAFKFVGKVDRDAVSAGMPAPLKWAERVGAEDGEANKPVSKTFVVRWPYPDRPVPFPFSAVGGGELSDVQCGLWGQAILSVDIEGKVIGWKYSKGSIIAARKREDGQVEVVLGERGNYIHLYPHYVDLQNSYWTNIIYTVQHGLAVYPSVPAYASFGESDDEEEAQRVPRNGWRVINEPGLSILPGRDGWMRQLSVPTKENGAHSFENFLPPAQVIYAFPFMDSRYELDRVHTPRD